MEWLFGLKCIVIVKHAPRSLGSRRSIQGLLATNAPTCAGKSSSLVARTKLVGWNPGRPGVGLRSKGRIKNPLKKRYPRLKSNWNKGTNLKDYQTYCWNSLIFCTVVYA